MATENMTDGKISAPFVSQDIFCKDFGLPYVFPLPIDIISIILVMIVLL